MGPSKKGCPPMIIFSKAKHNKLFQKLRLSARTDVTLTEMQEQWRIVSAAITDEAEQQELNRLFIHFMDDQMERADAADAEREINKNLLAVAKDKSAASGSRRRGKEGAAKSRRPRQVRVPQLNAWGKTLH
jgi:hypothetical protein